MQLLPINLAGLTAVAQDDNAGRFALNGVQLKSRPDGFQAAATDTRVLIVVRGKDDPLDDRFPTIPAVAEAPNGATSSVIPTEQWGKIFKDALRDTKKVGRHAPVMKRVAVTQGEKVTTFGYHSGEYTNPQPVTRTVENLDGRFPDVDSVMPRGPAEFTVRLEIKALAKLITAAKAILGDDGIMTLDVLPPNERGNRPSLYRLHFFSNEIDGKFEMDGAIVEAPQSRY